MNRKVLGLTAAGAAYLGYDLFQRMSTRQNRGIAKGKRFVILGGGFAGVEAVRELERLLPEDDNGEIVLVNDHEYLLFTPMLTEAVGANIEPHHIIVPLKLFARRSRLVIGKVEQIDLKSRTVTVGGLESQTLIADHLIICLGASSNYHHIPGAEQSAVPVKTLEDANRIRHAALALVKQAARETNNEERKAMLTFIVAGGGYTGVETIAALNDMVRDCAHGYSTLDESDFQMIIAEPTDRLMNEITPDLAAYTQKELERAGIRVLLKTGVKSCDGDTVELTNGEKIRARTFIWSAGVEANSLVGSLPAPKGKSKGLKVEGTFALPGFAGVWALGDNAEVPQPEGKGSYAATAQNATREGKLVAQNVVSDLKGSELEPFRYTPVGELAIVGRRRGVARVYGHNFSGFTAYLLWRAIYVAKMPSMRQRLRVLSDWLSDLVLGPVAEYRYLQAPSSRAKVTAAGESGK